MSVEAALITVVAVGIGAALYAYLGFPMVAAFLGAVCPRGRVVVDRRRSRRQVTVIISAFNEEWSIAQKIRNVLESEYPRERLDVLVVSDASTDRTNEIVRSFESDGVRLLPQPERRGKSIGLNDGMALARGDVVVFTDANATFGPDTIPKLVRYFADPVVGLVTGYTRYVTRGSREVANVTNLHTSLERMIKTAESRWGSCVGADGAVFAIRRRLFRPLRYDDINDFVMPLDVIAQGAECVFAADASCSEPTGSSVESEFRRQARITNRTLRALWRHLRLLNVFRFGLFSFFLFSHKIVRFLVPVMLTCSLVALMLLAGLAAPWLAVTMVLAGGAALAMWRRLPTIPSSWTFFGRASKMFGIAVTMHAAALQGWWHFLIGRRDVVWQHDRQESGIRNQESGLVQS
jgi:cellulose synthase/poly-beta-1,6-N-acetylglucosamine synthase-like glycosyltransferase